MKGRKVKFDKETFIVIAIALAILVGWGIYYPKQQAEQAKYNQQQAMIARTQAQYAELARKQETQNADGKADLPQAVAKKMEPEASKPPPPLPPSRFFPLLHSGMKLRIFRSIPTPAP